jgi:hypothetical protein
LILLWFVKRWHGLGQSPILFDVAQTGVKEYSDIGWMIFLYFYILIFYILTKEKRKN